MFKSINGKKKIFTLTSIILAVVLIYIKSTSTELIQIKGKAEIKIGNNMPSAERSRYKQNIIHTKVQVIAIPGKVMHFGKKSISIDKIPSNAIIK